MFMNNISLRNNLVKIIKFMKYTMINNLNLNFQTINHLTFNLKLKDTILLIY